MTAKRNLTIGGTLHSIQSCRKESSRPTLESERVAQDPRSVQGQSFFRPQRCFPLVRSVLGDLERIARMVIAVSQFADLSSRSCHIWHTLNLATWRKFYEIVPPLLRGTKRFALAFNSFICNFASETRK
jgi:hypothetical protein